jgi:small subunit ribosomal protein S17
MQPVRNKRKEKTGLVLVSKMEKTITVQVQRIVHHPWFGKTQKKYSKFKVHDEKKEAKPGDIVRITETRPISKTKRWRLVEILNQKGKK